MMRQLTRVVRGPRPRRRLVPSAAALALMLAWGFIVMPPTVLGGEVLCPGDCNGDRFVAVSELVTTVRIELSQAPVSDCPAADRNQNGEVTIDDAVAAVDASLNGCGASSATATPTLEALVTPTATVPTESSPTPVGPSAQTPTATPTIVVATTTPVATSTASTGTPTSSPVSSATPSPSAAATFTGTLAPSAMATLTPTPTRTATASATATVTVPPTSTRTATASPTATATAASSASPTVTATHAPLGTRRFSIDPTSSGSILMGQGVEAQTLGFTGFLDLTAGIPDPVTGLAYIDITSASNFISLDLGGGMTLCIHPLVPIAKAGVVACNGGVDLGASASQDHHVGQVGVGGFTDQSCSVARGTVESAMDPHPNVCNGPIVLGPSGTVDQPAGAVLLGPNADFGTQGLLAQVTVEAGSCQGNGPSQMTTFSFTSGPITVRIFDANNLSGQVLDIEDPGEPFSCAAWTSENGPGRLIQARPVLHGLIDGSMRIDAASLFVFDD